MTTEIRLATDLHDPALYLRRVLLADAVTCVATGALMSLFAHPIAGLTLIPPAIPFYAGLSLLPIAAFMAFVAARLPLAGVWLVIVGNGGWVAGSLWLLVGPAVAPNELGVAFIALQAAAVALLAGLEYVGVRHMTA